MSNHSTHPFGGGRHPALRSPRIGRRSGSLWLVLGLLVCASNAIRAEKAVAAEIVEVRIGKHAEFTRVVFELDRAAGYRIERTVSASGVTELVVSIEATSIPSHIASPKTLITKVDVTPSGGRSIARIAIVKDGLRLKEMILSSPPRIVLDVLSDAPVVAKAPVVRKASTPLTVAASKKSAPKAPSVVAKAPTPVEVVEIEAPSKIVPSVDKSSSDSVTDSLTESASEAVATVEKASDDSLSALDSAAKSDSDSTSTRTAALDEWPADPAIADEIDSKAAGQLGQEAQSDAVARAHALIDTDAPLSASATRSPSQPPSKESNALRPMVAKAESDGGGGIMTWALAAIGFVVLLLGGALVMRNRNRSDEDSDHDGTSANNPFSGADSGADQMNQSGTEGAALSDASSGPEDATIVTGSEDLEEKESESVVFGSEEETMEVISRDAVNESLGMPPEMGALPAEFQQMIRDMNGRVQALEGRIDELVDSRDRLERQVAAQTEELRVQRAAIARTQRAVRNLARPEDEEQEATEPALRDPNQPSSNE